MCESDAVTKRAAREPSVSDPWCKLYLCYLTEQQLQRSKRSDYINPCPSDSVRVTPYYELIDFETGEYIDFVQEPGK